MIRYSKYYKRISTIDNFIKYYTELNIHNTEINKLINKLGIDKIYLENTIIAVNKKLYNICKNSLHKNADNGNASKYYECTSHDTLYECKLCRKLFNEFKNKLN